MNTTYLVASLPMLFFGDPPPFPVSDFRARCEGVLDAADLRTMDALLAGRPEEASGPFAHQWRNRETQLRNAVAAVRASRYGVDARGATRMHTGYDVSVEESVTDAFSKASPLDREMELDRCRWRVLDELARPEPFGRPAVLAFALKLQIAERWAAMKDGPGRQRVEELVGAAAPAEPARGT